jgi:hypothetical protein
MATAEIRPGFDIGNVILTNDTDAMTPSAAFGNSQRYIAGAIRTIAAAVNYNSSDNTYLISKCGAEMQVKTLNFFEETDFYERTGVNPEHILFCRRRRDKAPLAAELGLTHFVDDRLPILRSMVSVGVRVVFQHPRKPPLTREMLQPEDKAILIAHTWRDVGRIILPNV